MDEHKDGVLPRMYESEAGWIGAMGRLVPVKTLSQWLPPLVQLVLMPHPTLT